jgi:hypothetical protein
MAYLLYLYPFGENCYSYLSVFLFSFFIAAATKKSWLYFFQQIKVTVERLVATKVEEVTLPVKKIMTNGSPG